MCGIAGVRRFGKTPITAEEIIALLCALEHRGQHATGIAIVNDGTVAVHKAALPAWRFCQSDDFQLFVAEHLTDDTLMVLLHTRWATGGNPNTNENNHPMFDGETAITHNGMIMNSEALFHEGKYKKTCETDSDIIRAIVAQHGFHEKGIRELNKMDGSAAIACASTKHPGELLLARSGSPLCYGWDADGGKMYWASEVQAILKAGRAQYKEIRGTWVQPAKVDMSVGVIPDHTAWLFDGKARILHAEFKVCKFYRQPDYSRGRQTYHSKRAEWKRDTLRQKANKTAIVMPSVHKEKKNGGNPLKGAVIQCPSCGSNNTNAKGQPWKDLVCYKCDGRLTA